MKKLYFYHLINNENISYYIGNNIRMHNIILFEEIIGL